MPDKSPRPDGRLVSSPRPDGRLGALDASAAVVFVSVVTAGSFTRAARALGMPSSTVSDKVSQLERRLGVTLLHRTTRKLNLTEVGREYFEQAEAGVSLLRSAAEQAAQAQRAPRGTLRLTAPSDIAYRVLAQAIAEYQEQCPDVRVETHLTNRYVDLITEGFDLAIRGGHLKDSGLVAKRLGSGHMILVASPEYVKRAKAPKSPAELSRHRCICFLSGERADPDPTWRLRSHDGRTARVRLPSLVAADSFAMVIDLARIGQGVALVPESLARETLQRHELLRLLPDWATTEAPVHLVYPPQRQALPKVRAMIPLLEKHFIRMFAGERI